VGVDRRNRGAYVARSASHEEVTGKPGLPEYVAQVVGRSGSFRSPNREGLQLLAGYYRSSVTGWFFTANIPVATLERPLRASLLQLTGFGVGAFVLSCALALLFSRAIVEAAGDLAEQARVLGDDGEVTPVRTHLSEFARISDALVGASDAITTRANERERAEAHRRLLVNELNHRVKNSLTIAQSIASQKMRSAKSIGEARASLSSRLVSLARTHDVLTREIGKAPKWGLSSLTSSSRMLRRSASTRRAKWCVFFRDRRSHSRCYCTSF